MEIRNLTKSFDGKKVLDNFNIVFDDEKKYCLMAPSGTGKTTFLRILMGLETPDSGTAAGLGGKRISTVFQEERLLEGYSAQQNLQFVTGNQYTIQELTDFLKRLLPEDELSKPVCEFSGGMRRRVEILRAILAPSDLILMDEPFSGLDYETKCAAIEMIKEYAAGKLLIIATHSEEDAGLLGAEIVRLDETGI